MTFPHARRFLLSSASTFFQSQLLQIFPSLEFILNPAQHFTGNAATFRGNLVRAHFKRPITICVILKHPSIPGFPSLQAGCHWTGRLNDGGWSFRRSISPRPSLHRWLTVEVQRPSGRSGRGS